MTLQNLTTIANNYTDENFSTNLTLGYMNTALSKINIALKSTLPFVSDASADYTALSDSWLIATVVPYLCWSIKMNDGSINEAREYQYQFETALRDLIKNKSTAIGTDYQGSGFKRVYQITPYTGMLKTSPTVVLTVDSTAPLGEEEE